MGDLRTRISSARTKLLRRGSGLSASSRSSAGEVLSRSAELPGGRQAAAESLRDTYPDGYDDGTVDGEADGEERAQWPRSDIVAAATSRQNLHSGQDRNNKHSQQPQLVVQEATPDAAAEADVDGQARLSESGSPSPRVRTHAMPSLIRRQSLVAGASSKFMSSLLGSDHYKSASSRAEEPHNGSGSINASMLYRKVWVKRSGASATLVQICEDDLVDAAREAILRKYANSLGRNFDAPDLTLRIASRDPLHRSGDRMLGPEEDLCRTLDAYYPGGQSVSEALIIDTPQRRTPRPSSRGLQRTSYCIDDSRPGDHGLGYFPPMPMAVAIPTAASPGGSLTPISYESRQSHHGLERPGPAIATGQAAVPAPVPLLPSPGGSSIRRAPHHGRPKPSSRQDTTSPTAVSHASSLSQSTTLPLRHNTRPRVGSNTSEERFTAPTAPPIPTPPIGDATLLRRSVSPPAPGVTSPRLARHKKSRKATLEPLPLSLPSGLLDGSVPPINVLIVEDNIINLKLLEAFMKRLKVRWQAAMNGRDAVTMWRAGGFHLVLMDIQLPIMNGLEATKEIRRLERVNGIGVLGSASSVNGSQPSSQSVLTDRDVWDGDVEGETDALRERRDEDKLGTGLLFKSPVIIVALTASSLQSDRHEALAAGCNDFLTKPVNFVWLERKVKEWGCMQALIDFDGWRKWKDFTNTTNSDNGNNLSRFNSKASYSSSRFNNIGSTSSQIKINDSKLQSDGKDGSSDGNADPAADQKQLSPSMSASASAVTSASTWKRDRERARRREVAAGSGLLPILATGDS